MSGSEEDAPVPPDETEILEEGDRESADVPIRGDATEVVPLSIAREDGKSLHLSRETEGKKKSR